MFRAVPADLGCGDGVGEPVRASAITCAAIPSWQIPAYGSVVVYVFVFIVFPFTGGVPALSAEFCMGFPCLLMLSALSVVLSDERCCPSAERTTPQPTAIFQEPFTCCSLAAQGVSEGFGQGEADVVRGEGEVGRRRVLIFAQFLLA
jgi:hypothetical protein